MSDMLSVYVTVRTHQKKLLLGNELHAFEVRHRLYCYDFGRCICSAITFSSSYIVLSTIGSYSELLTMAVKLGSSSELQIIGGAAQLAPPRPKLERPLRVVREVAEPLSIQALFLQWQNLSCDCELSV